MPRPDTDRERFDSDNEHGGSCVGLGMDCLRSAFNGLAGVASAISAHADGLPGVHNLRQRVGDLVEATRNLDSRLMSAKIIVQKFLADADIQVDGSRPWDIQVHNSEFYSRVLAGTSLALGESYMDGWWDCEALDQFAEKLFKGGINERSNLKRGLLRTLQTSFFNLQNRETSKESVQHYDIDNNLYVHMLGETMAYTCGYWKDAETLEEAQEAKFELICQKLKLEPGMTVLDLGCGFGSFAKYAAEHYGVEVVGVNIAEEQLKFARESCAGNDSVEFRNMDYRDVEGQFDRIVTIGMVEHVGPKNYKAFMKKVRSLLKDDGLFLYHGIGKNLSGITTDPWFDKYIFPNAVLPSPAQITTASEGELTLEDWHNLGADYDKTLMAWYHNFKENWGEINRDGKYDKRFYRMWSYYLLTCAGDFRSRRHNQLWQVVFSKDGVAGGYESVR
jgi:cyclopropane-fatty-acyl-phospholipid synthase